MTVRRFFWRLRKKLLKRWARNCFFPSWRVRLLRWCGYHIGQGVYIADDLIIAEELEDSGNLEIGDRVSIAPRVTLVLSSHPNESRIRPFAPVRRAPKSKAKKELKWVGTGRGCPIMRAPPPW